MDHIKHTNLVIRITKTARIVYNQVSTNGVVEKRMNIIENYINKDMKKKKIHSHQVVISPFIGYGDFQYHFDIK